VRRVADSNDDHSYLGPEAIARREIDRRLAAAGWVVQDRKRIALGEKAVNSPVAGVAVREVELKSGHGVVDYLLFVDGVAVGVLEAKKNGTTLVGVETQSARYAAGLPDWLDTPVRPLPFAYESTGVEIKFTNRLDPVPRSREVHWFHRPEHLKAMLSASEGVTGGRGFRSALRQMPELSEEGLRPAQFKSIAALEASLAKDKPRALIQMATGAGKTFTAVSETYRLLKFGDARRVCFLVDRANLGRQALREFQTFVTPDTHKRFTDLHNVQLLSRNGIDPAAEVVITTIQRLYSMLRGEAELDPDLDEKSLEELTLDDIPAVEYQPHLPVELFDLVFIDECHRSIYGLWSQVLDYFDAHLVGLTATPNKQALGFFNRNLVATYNHEQAVADKVNVDFDVYRIRTRVGEEGATIEADGETVVKFRDRLSGQTRLVALQDDVVYDAKDLDRAVVTEDQLRTVIREFREKLFTDIFPGRTEVPKTLVFAKDDAHADRIVTMLREEFDRPNEFAAKITYRTTGRKPEELLAEFRNSYNPRIAVTVDMIATGTDVKPLEIVFFLRSVKSRNFFEQMKGRGVRVINDADFQAVTPDSKTKTHFVIVDAVGVTETELNETTPLDRSAGVPLGKLLDQVSLGASSPDLASSLGSRLMRMDKSLTADDRAELAQLAGGLSVVDLAGLLVRAVDPDLALATAQNVRAERGDEGEPSHEEIAAAQAGLVKAALQPLRDNPDLREALTAVRRNPEQLIDNITDDEIIDSGFSKDATDRARKTVEDFRQYIHDHHAELTALDAMYGVPHQRRLTFREIKQLANAISRPPHMWTAETLWEAFAEVEGKKVRRGGRRMTTDLVNIVRFALEQDDELVPYVETVEQRFSGWLEDQQATGRRFTPSQVEWLERIRDVIASSLTVSLDDFGMSPLLEQGGLGGAAAVFGDDLASVLDQLNTVLAA
jgi:type I restriction enzyme R subunit